MHCTNHLHLRTAKEDDKCDKIDGVMSATLSDLVETDVNVEHVKFGKQAGDLRDQIRRNQGVLKQRHCTMYESSDKDEEGKRQGTRKNESDEEGDDYPAANSLDLIKICFSLSGCFFFSLLPLFFSFFLLFSFFFLLLLQLLAVAWGGLGGAGGSGHLYVV